MTETTDTEAKLARAVETERDAQQALNSLREKASRGEVGTPSELNDAAAALEIAHLQRETAETQHQAQLEEEADQEAKAFANRVEQFVTDKPNNTRELFENYRKAAIAYVTAVSRHNTSVRSLIREAASADPSGTHARIDRNITGRSRDVYHYAPPHGIHTDNASARIISSPSKKMNDALETALRKFK